MARFAKETMEDETTCPYCGSCKTDYIDESKYGDEVQYHCCSCKTDYFIMYNENSWDDEGGYYTEVIDITDRHRVSLLVDEPVNEKDTKRAIEYIEDEYMTGRETGHPLYSDYWHDIKQDLYDLNIKYYDEKIVKSRFEELCVM